MILEELEPQSKPDLILIFNIFDKYNKIKNEKMLEALFERIKIT